ncbi:double-strand break repair helicase AddA [Nitrobacter sp.]|uniref:double-strand break repair helicase AddA n=1 Tax=unclassified Nitrobacter TaxID=2620411 RepID=UPI002B8A7B6E|nr:double-strand break repair helicase AddA [Nitrobacter sp.]
MVGGRRAGVGAIVKAPRPVHPDASARQQRASDPAASVFVSANAGSGKTHVLVQRVIRLLLNNVDPARILCITFTKAAAANMAERVFSTLGRWVTLEDEALDAALRDAGIAQPDARWREQARKLFASALETPGGLKVQTIHALCTRLLQQFPFEAEVPARFTVLDERDQTEMMERASIHVMLDAAENPDSPAGRALRYAMGAEADTTLRDVISQACLRRDHAVAWTGDRGTGQAVRDVADALGVDPDERVEDVEREMIDGPNLPRSKWLDTAALIATGSSNDIKQSERLRDAHAEAGDTAQADRYLDVFLTGGGSPRKSFVTKKISDVRPDIAEMLADECQRVIALLARRRAINIRDRTQSLLVIAAAVAAHYGREKHERGLLDYDDLIDKTLRMLEQTSPGWVHYKLDRGVDHVLIDEAQDTSPKQWDIVERIIADFTAGEGAREGVRRTVFAVGDEKQSIFSFQGAAPREFDERRRKLEMKFTDAKLPFRKEDFIYSFRSGKAILESVDHVFRDPGIYASIHAVGAHPVHESLADAAPGIVDLWNLEERDPREEIEGWRAPFDAVTATSPEVKLARRIRNEIRTLIAQGAMTGHLGNRRPLGHGDILVLVRRRGSAFNAVIQALKQSGIPVAGADRLKLTEHIAIIDLMNLTDALLLPRDDLALAVALKSPLFGLDDDDLFKLAWQRKGSLRDALAGHATASDKFRDAFERLKRCESRAARDTPFAFFAWLLGEEGGRRRILRRLGHEANDALDEFLELALAYERKAPASLQGFMAWLRAADTEVKRDMEISRDEVRVMTVHGAKGLEASVVFLADTSTSPADTERLSLIRMARGNAPAGHAGVTIWAGSKAEDPPCVAQARAAMTAETEHEYRRLLYVAMTRAADRLIVGGCKPGNVNKVRELSWYDLIEKGLGNSGLAMQAFETETGKVRRFTRPDHDDPGSNRSRIMNVIDSNILERDAGGKPLHTFPHPALEEAEPDAASPVPTASPGATPIALPPWLHLTAAPEAPASRSLQPSDADEAAHHRLRAGVARDQRHRARLRGTLAHRLLQSLPEVPQDRRRETALSYLARNASGWGEAERDLLAAQVVALLDDARFAAIFADGSRAEVAIAGRLTTRRGDPLLVSGQIDRLVITPTGILVVDYKTSLAPANLAGVPPPYIRQLALYRAVLASLYPELPVKAALLWTETPEMIEVSVSAMDAALEAIITM